MISEIRIIATEVASIAKFDNRFQQYEAVFENVWRRSNEQQYMKVRREIGKERKMMIPTLSVNSKQKQIQVENVQNHYCRDLASRKFKQNDTLKRGIFTANYFNQIIRKPNSKAPTAIRINELQRQYGKKNEEVAIEEFQRITNKRVTNKGEFFSHFLEHEKVAHQENGVIITGRVDGMISDGPIEIKSRIRGLREIREHEYVQLQTYLFLTDKEQAQLVQYFPETEHERHLMIEKVHRDETFWKKRVAPHLIEFATSLTLLMEKTELQKRFLLQPQGQREIIRSLLIQCGTKHR